MCTPPRQILKLGENVVVEMTAAWGGMSSLIQLEAQASISLFTTVESCDLHPIYHWHIVSHCSIRMGALAARNVVNGSLRIELVSLMRSLEDYLSGRDHYQDVRLTHCKLTMRDRSPPLIQRSQKLNNEVFVPFAPPFLVTELRQIASPGYLRKLGSGYNYRGWTCAEILSKNCPQR